MIKYAGAPQLGDYVIINDDDNNYVRLVTSVIENINQPTTYHLGNGAADWPIEELTRVKPYWNVGELVRYKGRVHQILTIEVKNYKFVYSLEDIGQWIAEDELEEVNSRYLFHPDDWISINKYCTNEQFRGMKGRINAISHLGANCFLSGIGLQSYDILWEAIDIIEPYNAELICVKGEGAWKEGELAKVIDNHFYFIDRTGSMCCDEEKVYNLNDVNNLFNTVRFAEIKETIGDKAGWNGKFYVVDTTADSALKVGNVYVVKDGILNSGAYSFMHIFTSFEEIQKRFSYLTLIEVKE